jgi:hypothetical protein
MFIVVELLCMYAVQVLCITVCRYETRPSEKFPEFTVKLGHFNVKLGHFNVKLGQFNSQWRLLTRQLIFLSAHLYSMCSWAHGHELFYQIAGY